MPEFRRGLTAIEQANAPRKRGGFLTTINWREDREEKYVLILSPIDEVVTVDLHEWVPVTIERGGESIEVPERFVNRKDRGIGEDYDELSDRLGHKSRVRTIGIAVELEPVLDVVDGRKRPKKFVVATDTYTRRTDDGEVEVETPKIGELIQSPKNFWGWLGSYDATQGSITETPMQVIRRGKGTDTEYDFMPVMGVEIDLSNLVGLAENIGYATEEAVNAAQSASNDMEGALALGNYLLTRRVEELTDKERYDSLVNPIQEIPDKFGGGNKIKPKAAASGSNGSAASSEVSPDTGDSKMDRFQEMRGRVESRNQG